MPSTHPKHRLRGELFAFALSLVTFSTPRVWW